MACAPGFDLQIDTSTDGGIDGGGDHSIRLRSAGRSRRRSPLHPRRRTETAAV